MSGTDGYQDDRTYNSSVTISWDAKYLSLSKITYSFGFGYDAYVDEVYPDSSYQNFSFSFGLKTPF